eukprot:evm.model.scf_1039.1 EVM.evm.TU.scf_1039.1   scf_1039:32251-41950(-)
MRGAQLYMAVGAGGATMVAVLLGMQGTAIVAMFANIAGGAKPPEGNPYQGLAAIHMEMASHECSGVLITRRFVLTTSTCAEAPAGSHLAVDVIKTTNDDVSSFRRYAHQGEVAKHPEPPSGASNVALMRLSTPVDTPVSSLDDRTESVENDIVYGDTVFVPDAWNPGMHREMKAGRLGDCVGIEETGTKLACAVLTRPTLTARSVGGPVYKKIGQKVDHPGNPEPDAHILAGVVMYVADAPGGRQEIGIINISFAIYWFKRVIYRESGWEVVPQDRLPAFCFIPPQGSSHGCKGMLINGRYVLTAAHCVDGLGTNPKVVVGATRVDEQDRVHGRLVVRAERAHTHPRWTGKVKEGFDVAVLELPYVLDVKSPVLVDTKRSPSPDYTALGAKAYGFRLLSVLEAAPFEVVFDNVCPGMGELENHMFCAYSDEANLHSGCSGGPILVLGSDLADGDPTLDLVVGVVSCANYATESSGVGCADVSGVIGWIRRVIYSDDF